MMTRAGDKHVLHACPPVSTKRGFPERIQRIPHVPRLCGSLFRILRSLSFVVFFQGVPPFSRGAPGARPGRRSSSVRLQLLWR